MTDKVINMPDGRSSSLFFLHRRRSITTMENIHQTDDDATLFECTQSSKSCFVALHNCTAVLFGLPHLACALKRGLIKPSPP